MPHKNREEYNAYMRKYMLRRYYKRRAAAIEQLGGRCAVCREDDDALLDFDHVDASTRSFVICSKLSSISEAKLQAELAKCQLLCKACHGKKSVEAGELPRGVEKSNTKLTEADIREMRRRHRRCCKKNGAAAIGRDYGVSITAVLSIIKRKTWKHV